MNKSKTNQNHLYRIIDQILNTNQENSKDNASTITFENIDFNFEEPVQLALTAFNIYFKNCSISGHRIDIILEQLEDIQNCLGFEQCKINSDLYIKESKLEFLSFKDVTISSNNFFISSNEINKLSIVGDSKIHSKIKNLTIYDNLKIDSVDIRLNDFDYLYINNCNFINNFTLNVNTINKILIEKSIFNDDLEFWKNIIIDEIMIKKSQLNRLISNQNNLGFEANFRDVTFNETVNFINLKTDNSYIKFQDCIFQKNTNFDQSTIKELSFESVIFRGITSFQNVKILNTIILKKTLFEKNAFFDGISISNEKSLDINTLQILKGQLQKSENKIEYLKYNALEQRKYLQTLKLSDSDFYVLKLNSMSNNFGTDWFKGAKFTLKTSMSFYILIILVNSFISSTYPLKFNTNLELASPSFIISEFLKFTFTFGFNNEDIQSNGYLYLIFIISKIFISYGIYQTITAFRKFGKL